jgi:RND family efflux transporter MFP subunit
MKVRFVSATVLTRVLGIAAGFVVLVLAIAWLAGTFVSKIEPGHEQPVVRRWSGESTDEVHEVTKSYIEEAVGSLKAASRTAISAKVLATILEITATAGDQVKEGDVLIRLDSKELDARVRQAEQSLAAAVAARTEAEQNFNRVKPLHEKRVIAKADFDQATAKLEVAKAGESRADQAVSEAKALLSYATIKAPKSGRIVDRLAEEGDTARPGEPLLVLYDAASLRLEAPVQENLAVKLQVGQKLDVYVDAIGREVEAAIDEIVPQADAPSRSFLVKAALPRATDLYEGMFGRLRIPAGSRRHLCLATDAIQNVGQLEFVDVVMPDETLERRFIKTGRLGMPGRIEVLSGLQAGETVVLQSGP